MSGAKENISTYLSHQHASSHLRKIMVDMKYFWKGYSFGNE